MHELKNVLDRIERLERENRRWKRAGALLATGLIAALSFGFAAPANDVLRGKSLELTTDDGTTYAQIKLDKGYPILLLQKERAHALMTLNKPAMHIRDEDGRRGAFVGFDTRGNGKIELAGTKLHDGVRMQIKPDGTSGVYVLDEEGYDRGTLEYSPEGQMAMTLRAPKGDMRNALVVDPKGNSSVLLLDSSGRRRVGMLVKSDGTPLISMEDERLAPRMNMTMDFDGTARLDFVRPDGAVGKSFP